MHIVNMVNYRSEYRLYGSYVNSIYISSNILRILTKLGSLTSHIGKYSAKHSPTVTEIFSALSDEDSLEMFQMIENHEGLNIDDFDSPKRYYRRLTKLKKSLMITKRGKESYELTALGSILHEIIQCVRLARELHWKLQAIDSLDDKVPSNERQKIIESLISDKIVRAILLAKCRGESQVKKEGNVADLYKQSTTSFQLLEQK